MSKKRILMYAIAFAVMSNTSQAKESQQQLEWYAEDMAVLYDLSPTFVKAVIFKESSWRTDVVTDEDNIGLMQIDESYHRKRMEKLGVTDLYNPKDNIKVGCDYLAELFEEYDDPYEVLMIYNMGSRGKELYEQGRFSKYAKDVCIYADELTRQEETWN